MGEEDIYGTKQKEIIMEEGQKYVAVFDPLDGSSNVDANIPTGTIFGIYEEPEGCSIEFIQLFSSLCSRNGNQLCCELFKLSPELTAGDIFLHFSWSLFQEGPGRSIECIS